MTIYFEHARMDNTHTHAHTHTHTHTYKHTCTYLHAYIHTFPDKHHCDMPGEDGSILIDV